MRKVTVVPLAMALLGFSACVAPLSSGFSGAALGKGGLGFDLISGGSGDFIWSGAKMAWGVGPRLDLGFQAELGTLGFYGKYSILNGADKGFSLAGLFGAGATGEGTYVYAGPVISCKMDFLEPYFVARYNSVHVSENSDLWGVESYSYYQLTFGGVLWVSRRMGFLFELSTFSGETDQMDFEGPLYMGGLKIRF